MKIDARLLETLEQIAERRGWTLQKAEDKAIGLLVQSECVYWRDEYGKIKDGNDEDAKNRAWGLVNEAEAAYADWLGKQTTE